jgi:integrase/recombinase XerD
MIDATSCIALDQAIAAYLAHQRALGRGYGNEQRVLNSVRCFVARTFAKDLDQALFDRWGASLGHLAANTRRARQLIVHKFCRYRQRAEPHCFVPNPLYFARLQPYLSPILIEPGQVARMLAAADGLAPTRGSPLLPAVMRISIVLLYTAGLRRGELLRLTLGDVEPRSGILRIRESKFHKSRLVPLSSDARSQLRRYLHKRLAAGLDARPSAPLLCNTTRGLRAYTGTGISGGIHRLFELAGVHDDQGRRPRVHDMRHSFAIAALLRWYRAGIDVQSHLPRLAMYMGHVSIASTAYYLRFVPALARLASERFEQQYGDLLGEVEL